MKRGILINFLGFSPILFVIYLTSFYSYMLFHSVAEIFSIVIAVAVFLLAWNTRRFPGDNYLLFLGVAYLFVGILDLVHTLAYKGMGVFVGYDSNLPTQLWVVARYTEGVSALFSFVFLKKKLNPGLCIIVYSAIVSGLLISIFYTDSFPDCFVEGSGLTAFKKTSEYIISLLWLLAITLLYKNRERFDKKVFKLLLASFALTILSELSFAFYLSLFGLFNMVGHFFKIVSFYLMYKAIIVTGLIKPYSLLFRNLKQSEEELRKNNKKLEKEIIERKNIETRLEKSNLEIKQIFNGAADGIRVIDKNYNVLKINDSFLDYIGVTKEEAYRKKCREIFRGSQCQTDQCALRQILAGGEERVERELENTNPRGDKIPVILTATPYRNLSGEIIGVIESFKNVSRIKEVEKTIKEERDLFIKGFVVVFKWTNKKGWPVEYVSPNVERVLGYPVEEITSGNFLYADIIEKEDVDRIVKEKNQVIENGPDDAGFEAYRIRDKKNNIRWILDHTRFIKNELGEVDYFYGYLLDITDYRANEEKLERKAKLAHAGRLTALGEMASGMAHELNQPMTVIRLAADGLKMFFEQNDHGALEEEAVDDIIHQVKRAVKIIKNMRGFSSANIALPRPMDVSESIDTAVSFFREQFRIRRIELEVSVFPGLPKVKMDPQKFEQIVVNFLSNARYAVEDRKRRAPDNYKMKVYVRLYLSRNGKHLVFEVEDNGAGMSPEVADRCLDPFFTTKDIGEGTGLGLSIVHGITREFGMKIHIDGVEGKSCVFRVLMPAVND